MLDVKQPVNLNEVLIGGFLFRLQILSVVNKTQIHTDFISRVE